MPFRTNLLLDALTDAECQELAPHLSRIELKQHQVLCDIQEIVTKIYFVIDAVVSLVVPLSTGEVVESAMVGRDGVVGAAAALDGRPSLSRAVVQIGGQSLACDIVPFKSAVAKHSHLQQLVAAHEQVLFAQAQQSAVKLNYDALVEPESNVISSVTAEGSLLRQAPCRRLTQLASISSSATSCANFG